MSHEMFTTKTFRLYLYFSIVPQSFLVLDHILWYSHRHIFRLIDVFYLKNETLLSIYYQMIAVPLFVSVIACRKYFFKIVVVFYSLNILFAQLCCSQIIKISFLLVILE